MGALRPAAAEGTLRPFARGRSDEGDRVLGDERIADFDVPEVRKERGEAHGEAFYLHSTFPPYNPFFSDHPAGARKGILVRDIAARRGQIQKSESRTAA
jgi:hypothetical protein